MRLGTFKCAQSCFLQHCRRLPSLLTISAFTLVVAHRNVRSCCYTGPQQQEARPLAPPLGPCNDRLRRIDGREERLDRNHQPGAHKYLPVISAAQSAGRESLRRQAVGVAPDPVGVATAVSSAAVLLSLFAEPPLEAHSSMPWPLFLPTHRYPLTMPLQHQYRGSVQ